jgi:hypothetical protein
MIISDMRHPICGALAARCKVLDYVATVRNFARLFPQLSSIWCKILHENLTLSFLIIGRCWQITLNYFVHAILISQL